MRPLPFAAAVVATVSATLLVGSVVTFMATREEGFRHGWAWRVHLSDFGRAWGLQILEPGRGWETLLPTARKYGRDYAVATAQAAIDVRRRAYRG